MTTFCEAVHSVYRMNTNINCLFAISVISQFEDRFLVIASSRKQVRVMKTPLHPTYIDKTGVYRGLHYFIIFALKHILWVLVRTASMRRF